MGNLIAMIDNKIPYGSYIVLAVTIGGLTLITSTVELWFIKLLIGIGFSLACAATIKMDGKKHPMITLALFFMVVAVIAEFFQKGDRNASNHFFYIMASLSLILGILNRYFEEVGKEKGGE